MLSRVKGDDRLWRFVKEFLSAEDTSRFQSLPSVQTSVGYFRAWLRGSLNERTIENTLHLMLAEERTLRLECYTTLKHADTAVICHYAGCIMRPQHLC